MANSNAAMGLVPVSHINGSGWNGKTSRYYIAQSDVNVFSVGDVVVAIFGSGAGGATVAIGRWSVRKITATA